MIRDIHQSFTVLSSGPPQTRDELHILTDYFGHVPNDYLMLLNEGSEVELQHESGKYLRVWNAAGCIEMDSAYHIRENIPGAFPLGDDGGGQVLLYAEGGNGFGLYCVGYGGLDITECHWITGSLKNLLVHAIGIDAI